MNIFDKTLGAIDRGKDGGNEGLPYGIPSLVDYIPNIQQETYYLIGGETSSGKTALADYMFLYSPFEYLMANKGNTDKKLKILYWSFEISIENKIAKGICQKIWRDHKILVDVNYILSRGKNRISDEMYNLVLNTREYFEELHDILVICDVATNPTGITIRNEKFCKEHFIEEKIGEFEVKRTPKDPNLYLMGITDHIGLVRSQKDLTTAKDKIDYISGRNVEYRDKYRFIPVDISQFNRSLASAERELSTKNKPDYNKVGPQLSDFKDSGSTQENANVVLSIFSPNRYGIPEYNDYQIKDLKDRIRMLSVLKGRDGIPDLAKGLGYLGECGLYIDLPIPEKMGNLYSQISNLKKYNK